MMLRALFALLIASAFGGRVVSAQELRAPGDMDVGNAMRLEQLASDLGTFELKWSRTSEQLFGRTPSRALSDAVQTVRRALAGGSFPPALRTLNQHWSVVFVDSSHLADQVPSNLVSSCHPGWMTPPANIYVVADRAATFCGGGSATGVADQRLARILVHEMGHALEFQLLPTLFGGDPMRAEGFASWFEQYASNYSGIIPHGSVRADYHGMINPGSFSGQWQFAGSASDYARAALFFEAIESRRGVAGVMDVYGHAAENRDFWSSYRERTGWTDGELGRVLKQTAGVR